MLARAVTFNVLGQVATLAVGFLSSLLLARWLGPTDRGLLGLLESAATVGYALLALGMPVSIVTFASRADADRGALLGNSLAYAGVLTVVSVPLSWILSGTFSDALARGSGGRLWIFAGVLVSLMFLGLVAQNQVFALKRFGYANGVMVAARLVFLVAIAILVGWLGLGVGGGLVALCVSSLVVVAGSLAVVLPGARPRLDAKLFGEMARFGGRVQLGTIFQLANYRLDVFVLQLYRPLRDVGYYVVAQIVAELVVILATGFQNTLNVFVSSDEGGADATVRSLRHHSLLAGSAIVGMAGAGPLLLLAYGPSFYPAIVPMLILLPAMWFLGTGQVITGDLRGRGRPGVSSALAGAAMVVTIALDFALIPPLGVNGAAIASVCAYTVFGVGSLLVLSRIVDLPVRALVVPTRADLALYPAAVRSLRARVRRRPPEARIR
jgi:O-antigen/teichoic acid export membrane protein